MLSFRYFTFFILAILYSNSLLAYVGLKESSEYQVTDLKVRGTLRGAVIESEIDIAVRLNSTEGASQRIELLTPKSLVVSEFSFKNDQAWNPTKKAELFFKKSLDVQEKYPEHNQVSLGLISGRGYVLHIANVELNKKIWVKFKTTHELALQPMGFDYVWPMRNLRKIESFEMNLDFYVDFFEQIGINAWAKKIGAINQLDREGKHYVYKTTSDKINFVEDFHLKLNRQQISKTKKSVAVVHKILEKNEAWVDQNSEEEDQAIYGLHWLKGLPSGQRKLAKKILVFVDTSRGSRDRLRRENVLLFEKFLAAAPKSVKIQTFAFDSSVRPLGDIFAQISNLDGGSNFKSILNKVESLQSKSKDLYDVLIFSDFYFSLQSEKEIRSEDWKSGALFMLPQTQNYNFNLANQLSRQHGGFVLSQLGRESIDKIWQEMKVRLWRLKSIGLRSSLSSSTSTMARSFPGTGSTFRADEPLHVYIDLSPFAEDSSGIAQFSDGVNQVELSFNMNRKNDSPRTSSIFNYKLLTEFQVKSTLNSRMRSDGLPSNLFLEVGQCFGLNTVCPKLDSFLKSEDLSSEDIASRLKEDEHPPMTLAPPEPSKKALRKEWIESTVQVASDAKDVQSKFVKPEWTDGELLKFYLKSNGEFVADPWFFVEYAEAFQKRGDRWMAQKVISNLFEYGKKDSQYLRTLGLVGCNYNFCDFAVEALEKLIQKEPKVSQNYRDLAWIFLERNEADRAVEVLKRMKDERAVTKLDSWSEKEVLAIENFESDQKLGNFSKHWPAIYSWISWDNLEIDVDFWIKEGSESLVSFKRSKGAGKLLSDSNRGDRPEIYSFDEKKLIFPDYFASYHASEAENEIRGGVVKWVQVFRSGESKLIFKSSVVPLRQTGRKVKLNSPAN